MSSTKMIGDEKTDLLSSLALHMGALLSPDPSSLTLWPFKCYEGDLKSFLVSWLYFSGMSSY